MSDIAIVLILILAGLLLFRGPKILPRIGAALGHGVREAREAADRKFGSSDDEDTAPRPRP